MSKKQTSKNKLTLKRIVGQGYLPEELPPVFTSKCFSENISKLNSLNFTDKTSDPIIFSIPKKQMHRRRLSIPNPSHYLNFCKIIINNQDKILKNIKSKNSASVPTVYPYLTRSFETKDSYSQFLWDCFKLSHGMDYELSTDISRFYPTIYTHIIPWVIYGKEYAKKHKYNKKLYGNQLDLTLRNMQGGQTFGIPIGPDASNMVAELICSKIDQIINKKFPGIKFRRFRDDYRFYFSTKIEGEEILRFFETALSEFMLEKNDDKTLVREVPVVLEPEWIFVIREFIVRSEFKEQREDLTSLFSLILRYARQFPDAQVVKYSLHKFMKDIHVDNYVTIIKLLFRLAELDSRTMKDLAILLVEDKDKFSKKIIAQEIRVLLTKHINKNNTYEILWLLWISKVFGIRVHNAQASKILNGRDTLSIIMILDLLDNGLVSKKIGVKRLFEKLKQNIFGTEWWLLKYQAHLNKWIKGAVVKDPFFKKMKDLKISFYDTSATSIEKKKRRKKGFYRSFLSTLGNDDIY